MTQALVMKFNKDTKQFSPVKRLNIELPSVEGEANDIP
jgi:hypothetical protein